MDRHKQKLIDSAVKILDDEVALNINNAKEQLPKEAHSQLKDTINQVKHKFVDDLVEPIDYVLKSLLFQPDKNIIFDYIIKYLDTFIKEFDTLYSPSYKQKNWNTIQPSKHGFTEDNLTYIFELLYPSGKRVEEFEKGEYYDIIIHTIDKFLVPFKFLRNNYAPSVSTSPYRSYLKYHRRNIDLTYVNLISWQLSPNIHHTFIKIYMTIIHDFFVSIKNNDVGASVLDNKIEMLETKTGELERGLESVFRIASYREHEGGGKKQKTRRLKNKRK
jgi:hypothetical protein